MAIRTNYLLSVQLLSMIGTCTEKTLCLTNKKKLCVRFILVGKPAYIVYDLTDGFAVEYNDIREAVNHYNIL